MSNLARKNSPSTGRFSPENLVSKTPASISDLTITLMIVLNSTLQGNVAETKFCEKKRSTCWVLSGHIWSLRSSAEKFSCDRSMDTLVSSFTRAQHLLDWVLAWFFGSQLALSTVKKLRWFSVPRQSSPGPDCRWAGWFVYILNSVDQGSYPSAAYYRPCVSMGL